MHPQHFRLQIEPSLTYTASSNRVYEELPENFMESISPQQNQGTMQQNSPQLASLAPMNVTANDRLNSFGFDEFGIHSINQKIVKSFHLFFFYSTFSYFF